MFKITCVETEREEIKELLLNELVWMHIFGASLPDGEKTFNAAKKYIQSQDFLKVEVTDYGVYTKMQSSDETAFCLVDALTGENNFNDMYTGCEIEEILNKVMAKYPTINIEGEFEYQGAYFDVLTISTVDGKLIVEHSEEDDGDVGFLIYD